MFWTITDYIRSGNTEGVLKCLRAGGNIEERRSSNYTPLIYAAYHNKCDMIELLLDEGADIEAVDRSGLSALRTAIYYGQDEAAILLAQRGADASTIAYQQKTDFYAAVVQGKYKVVKALLLSGADPFVECGNKKTAIDLVSSGDLWVLLKTFTDLDMAIDSRSTEAVRVLLKKTLLSNEDAKVLKTYDTVKKASDTAVGEWQRGLSKLVEQFELDMLHLALRNGSTDFMDKVNVAVGKSAWTSTARLDLNGRNALHVAASLGDLKVVSYLLETHKCDSIASDNRGYKAVDLVKKTDEYEHICWILTEHEKKTRFLDLTSKLLEKNKVTTMELNKLPQFMTSIYDLGVVFCLGYGALTKDDMKQLLQKAFEEAVRMKLMFDNDAAVYFETVLRECKRLKLISQKDKDEWTLKAGHVNGENADWVRGIQHSLSQLEYRITVTERNASSLNKNYQSLRNALVNKILLDDERMRRRQLIGLITCGLFFCGGSITEGAFNWAFGLSESVEAVLTQLTETSAKELASSLGNATNRNFLKPGLEAILEQACIDQTEFTALLGEALALENAAAAPPVSVVDVKRLDTTGTTEKSEFPREQGYPKLVDYSHLSEDDLVAHPYHYVVFYSSGDLNKFEELVKHIGEEDGDVNATMEIRVPLNPDSHSFGLQGAVQSTRINWETVHASPAIYASYLGYVDIVEWFLQSKPASKEDNPNMEKSFVTINRAHIINKRLQDATTSA